MLTSAEQRCLLPFTAFAEPKPSAGRAEVWFEVSNASSSAFAGIWRPSPVGNVFVFLTCEPNPLVAPIHPKAMPVILQPEDLTGGSAAIRSGNAAAGGIPATFPNRAPPDLLAKCRIGRCTQLLARTESRSPT